MPHKFLPTYPDLHHRLLGDDWDTEIATAQRNSLITVVLISRNTSHGYYAREEIAAAVAMARQNAARHRVVPVFLESDIEADSSVPYGLRLKHGLTLSAGLTMRDISEALLAVRGSSS